MQIWFFVIVIGIMLVLPFTGRNKPGSITSAIVFFVLGICAVFASARTICLLGSCILATQGEGIWSKGIELDPVMAKLIQISPFVFFGISGIYLIVGLLRKEIRGNKSFLGDVLLNFSNRQLNWKEIFERGNQSLDAKQYRQAIDYYSQVLQSHPNHLESFINRGVARYNLKDYEGAIDDYSRVIRASPNSVDAYFNRAVARLSSKNIEGAIRDLNVTIGFDSKFLEAYLYRAHAYAVLDDYEEAIESCCQAIDLDPYCADAYFKRGQFYIELDEKEYAIQDYKKAAKIFDKQGRVKSYQKVLSLLEELNDFDD